MSKTTSAPHTTYIAFPTDSIPILRSGGARNLSTSNLSFPGYYTIVIRAETVLNGCPYTVLRLIRSAGGGGSGLQLRNQPNIPYIFGRGTNGASSTIYQREKICHRIHCSRERSENHGPYSAIIFQYMHKIWCRATRWSNRENTIPYVTTHSIQTREYSIRCTQILTLGF